MSSEEQEAAIGRAVAEFGEIRKELAAIYAEGERYASVILPIGKYFEFAFLRGNEPSPKQLEALDKMPAPDDLQALVARSKELNDRKSQLAEILKQAGLPL